MAVALTTEEIVQQLNSRFADQPVMLVETHLSDRAIPVLTGIEVIRFVRAQVVDDEAFNFAGERNTYLDNYDAHFMDDAHAVQVYARTDSGSRVIRVVQACDPRLLRMYEPGSWVHPAAPARGDGQVACA